MTFPSRFWYESEIDFEPPAGSIVTYCGEADSLKSSGGCSTVKVAETGFEASVWFVKWTVTVAERDCVPSFEPDT